MAQTRWPVLTWHSVPSAGTQPMPGPSSHSPAGRAAGHPALTPPVPGWSCVRGLCPPEPPRELRDWGLWVHVGSGALTLSWENSSLTSSLPCFANGAAEVSEGPSPRPPCLCGTGCRAEPGGLLVAWLSCWGSSGHRGCCRPCQPLCSQPPGPLVSQERTQCWLRRLDSHVRGKVSGFLAPSVTRGQRTPYLASVSPGIYLLDPQMQSRQEEP